MGVNRPWFLEPRLPKSPQIASTVPPLGGLVSNPSCEKVFVSDKSLIDIIEKLSNRNVLTEFEWLLVLRSDEQYQQMEEGQLDQAVQTVWRAILSDEQRFSKVVIKLVAGLARGYEPVTDVLLEQFPRIIPAAFKPELKLQAQVARYLRNKQYIDCAKLVLSLNQGLELFFRSLGLESKGQHIEALLCQAEAAIPVNPSTGQLTWWRSCQDHLDVDQTIEQLECLLAKVNQVVTGTPFENWIKKYCLPESKQSIWFRLSRDAQLKLKSMYNVIDFESVKVLFHELSEIRTDPGITLRESNHLQKRTSYWADFSDSFERVRFLLTARSEKLLNRQIDLSQYNVTVMESKPFNDKSEICIFEVGNFILIERFRGTSFDLGIFEKTMELESILFEPEYIDSYTLMKLSPDWVHDHRSYWQKRLTQFLKNKGIRLNPNSGRHWLEPLTSEQRLQASQDKERLYFGLSDIHIYFKIGRRP
ncbi:EH signature domain-containing protein [uncultured Ferrimonas sp.]|uniref:EH signature domain-containing protein n=1 Tax=uncultured Ferrimonas sp. TaxID=432640 RepID=UPI002637382D|nr:EH signature domain-containing protein [uncultured Ferrimonas sp.]